MSLVVANYCFRELFRGEFAVIFGMQRLSQLARIHFQNFLSSFDSLQSTYAFGDRR